MNLPPPIHTTTSPANEEDMAAAAMGFSAFGSTHPPAHPSKRKKYTHDTRNDGRDTATGGNMLPLGIAKGARETSSHAIEDQGEPKGGRNAEAKQQRGGNLDGERERERMQGDGSLLQKKNEDEEEEETAMLLKRQNEMLRRINEGGIETRMETTYTAEDDNNNLNNISEAAHHPETNTTTLLPRRHNTADAAPGSEEYRSTGPRGGTQDGFEGYTWHEWRKGVRGERGDMAFYDASFVEDPWRGFNKTRRGGGGGGEGEGG
ncbi:MAG: hypothetical protein LQ349_003545 [Xanthoria aureola]|nr:MAG: hypothetical protein LQ349_003545 [Xanthoria aureola]